MEQNMRMQAFLNIEVRKRIKNIMADKNVHEPEHGSDSDDNTDTDNSHGDHSAEDDNIL